jgi:hypothetical protein
MINEIITTITVTTTIGIVFIVVMSAGGGFNKETNRAIGEVFNMVFDKK